LKISIIIFCHNERDNIDSVIQSTQKTAGLISNDYEIIVVNDGSTDGTAEKIRQHSGIKVITHPVNSGIGMAIRSGYNAATKEFVCAIPGDGQFDVNELKQVQPFAINSFYSFYRPKTNYNPYRQFLTNANRFFNSTLLGISLKDVNWIKVYRKDQLQFVDYKLKSSIVESEICAKLIKAGCTPIQLPSVYHQRLSGQSQGGKWKTLRKTLLEMRALYTEVSKFKKHL